MLRSILRIGFCSTPKPPISKSDPIMLFASYPVGFPILKTLHTHFTNLTIVTHYTKPSNKFKNEVEIYCKEHSLPIFTPVKKDQTKEDRQKEWENFVEDISRRGERYRLGVVCAYGYMLPEGVVAMFDKGVVLAHPSLIPKYRGGSPIFHAICNGQKQSGASFMQVSANKFDHGNLLHQVRCPLGQKDSYQKIQKQLSQLMASQILQVIQNLDTLRPGKPQSSIDTSNIPAHQLQAKIHKQKNLNLNMPAQDVYNWSRALIAPRVKFGEQEIIVFFDKVFLEDVGNVFVPGQLMLKGKALYMKCSDRLLKMSGWQEIAKKPLGIHTFINRFIDKQKYRNEIVLR